VILEGLISLIVGALKGILSLLPQIDAGIPADIATGFMQLIYGIGYVFPVIDFLIMLGIWFAVTNFHVIWKLIQRLWDALPFT
jgi:hypothetical protein